MADREKIVTELELQGAEKVQRDFERTGDSAEQAFERMQTASEKADFSSVEEDVQSIAKAMQELVSHLSEITSSMRQTSDANSAYARSADEASRSTNNFVRSVIQIGAAVGAAAASVLGLRNAFEGVKQSMAEVAASANAADSLGTTFEESQKLEFIMRSLGLSVGEARAKLKEIGDTADDVGTKVRGLSAGAQELTEGLGKQGVRFAQTEQGLDAMRKSLAQFAQTAAGGRIPVADLQRLLEKFSDSTDPKDMIDFTNRLANLVSQGKALGQVFGDKGGLGKVIQIPSSTLTNLQAADAAFRKLSDDVSVKNFDKFVESLSKITDESERTKKAVELLGDKLGSNLSREIGDLQRAGASGADIVKTLSKDFDRLKIGVDESAVAIAKRFNRAMAQLASATEQGRHELGALLAPAITPFVETFTSLLRSNRDTIVEWATAIRDFGIRALTSLFDTLQGIDKDQVSGFLENMRTGVVAFGEGVVQVVDKVIIPAFNGLNRILKDVTDAINRTFGTSLSPATVGLVAALVPVLGIFNSIIVALGVLAGTSDKTLDAVSAGLQAIGVDVGAIKTAFDEISIAIQAAFRVIGEESGGAGFMAGVVSVLKEIPALVPLVVAAFFLLRRAAAAVAPVLSKIFQVNVTPLQSAILLVAGFFSGTLTTALTITAAAAVTVAAALRGIYTVMLILSFNPFVALTAALVLLIVYFDDLRAAAQPVANLINNIFGLNVSGADVLVGAIIAVGGALTAVGVAARGAFAALLPFIILLGVAISTWQEFKQALAGTTEQLDDFQKAQSKLLGEFLNLDRSAKDYQKRVDEINKKLQDLETEFANVGKGAQKGSTETKSALDSIVDKMKKATQDIRREVEEQSKVQQQGGGSTGQRVQREMDGVVKIIRGAGQAAAGEVKRIEDSFGKVIKIPQIDPSAIQPALKPLEELKRGIEQLVPPAPAIEDGLRGIKDKVSEVGEEFGDLPENMQLAAGEVTDLAKGIVTDFSSQSRKALDAIDQVSARIRGGTAGLGGGGNFLTEQLGDPSQITEMLPALDQVQQKANQVEQGMAQIGQSAGSGVGFVRELGKSTEEMSFGARKALEYFEKFNRPVEVVDGKIKEGTGSIDQFSEKTQQALDRLNKLNKPVEDVNGRVKQGTGAIDQFAEKTQTALNRLQKMHEPFDQANAKIKSTVQTVDTLPPAIQRAVEPANSVKTAVEGIEGAVKRAIEHLDKLRGGGGAGGQGQEGIIPGLPKTNSDLLELHGAVTKAAEGTAQFKESSAGTTESMRGFAEAVAASRQVLDGSRTSLQEVGTAVEQFGTTVQQVGQGLEQSLQAGFGGAAEGVKTIWDGLVVGVTASIDQVKQKILELQQLQQNLPAGQPTAPGQPPAPGQPLGQAPGQGLIPAGATAAVDALVAKIGEVRSAIASVINDIASMSTTLGTTFDGIAQRIGAIPQALSVIPQALTEAQVAADGLSSIISQIGQVAQSIQNSFNGFAQIVAQAFDIQAPQAFAQAMYEVDAAVQAVIASLQQAVALAQQLNQLRAGGGGGQGLVTGGPVVGPSGVDKVPLWGTAGEWMINRGAVRRLIRQFGEGVMPMINRGTLPIPRFAAGGEIPSLSSMVGLGRSVSAPSAGGPSSGTPRDLGRLQLVDPGGGEHTVWTDEETIQAIDRGVTKRVSRSAGRGASWYRGR